MVRRRSFGDAIQHGKTKDVIESALQLRHVSFHSVLVYPNHLKTRMQRIGEMLQEFVADILKLVRLAYPEAIPNLPQQLCVQHFIGGVKDPELQ